MATDKFNEALKNFNDAFKKLNNIHVAEMNQLHEAHKHARAQDERPLAERQQIIEALKQWHRTKGKSDAEKNLDLYHYVMSVLREYL